MIFGGRRRLGKLGHQSNFAITVEQTHGKTSGSTDAPGELESAEAGMEITNARSTLCASYHIVPESGRTGVPARRIGKHMLCHDARSRSDSMWTHRIHVRVKLVLFTRLGRTIEIDAKCRHCVAFDCTREKSNTDITWIQITMLMLELNCLDGRMC